MNVVRVLLGLVALLLVILAVGVWRLPSPAETSQQVVPLTLDETEVAHRLAGALQIPTVSEASLRDARQFTRFHAYLRSQYPQVFARLKVTEFGDSLLLEWPGQDATLAPALLAAHLDVVPAAPETLNQWTWPPFSGAINQGYIWGRGAMDDKSSLLGWMEAIALLLKQNFTPRQTVYFAFGHDEEIGGQNGAAVMTEALRQQGVRLEFVLDEGGVVGEKLVAGVDRPVATLMTAEKGYVTFKLSTKAEGGHSSMPPPWTAVGRLARAIARLEEHPMPARLVSPVNDMLTMLAPQMPLGQRVAIANRWLFEPVLLKILATNPTTNALIRTTTAPTMFNGGVKENVLPDTAAAMVNFRVLPGDTLEDVKSHIEMVVDDSAVQVERVGDWSAQSSVVSSIDNPVYRDLQQAVAAVFPDAIAAPGLVVGATDARHYASIADSRFNFLPIRVGKQDMPRFHGINERISVANYADVVRFSVAFLRMR